MSPAPIERLPRSAGPELVELLTDAFAQQAFMPGIGQSRETVRQLMKAFLKFYGRSPSLALHGIRQGERLVCGAVSVDLGEEPSLLTAAPFFLRLVRTLGWRTTSSFATIQANQPGYELPHRELALLGTAPSCQGQGLGRSTLQFVCDETSRLDRAGVVLVTDPSTPAFAMYRSFGFEVESEFAFAGGKLCWMRWRRASPLESL